MGWEAKLQLLKDLLAYAQSKPDVWIVSHAQLLAYMRNPVSADKLAAQPYMRCDLQPPTNICNGNAGSKMERCSWTVGWEMTTCYWCPRSPIMPDAVDMSTLSTYTPPPDDCDTRWWDPAQAVCHCKDARCAWKDTSRGLFVPPAGTIANAGGGGRVGLLHPAMTTAVVGSVLALAAFYLL